MGIQIISYFDNYLWNVGIQKTVLLSSVTDPFQPLNLKYKRTQKALIEIKNSNIDTNVEILTKSKLILKELKLIKSISNIKVGISLATLNDKISKRIEPGASLSSERIETLKTLHNEKIKCYVFISPIIPHITNVFQIIDEVYEYVDYICFENLNLRSPYKCEVLNFAKEVLPKDEYQDFERIFNDSNYGIRYWQQLEKRIEKYCQTRHITYKLYFYLNTHKPQVCYKHVFNKFLLNSIRNKEQTKIKKTVSADYGYSNTFIIIK